MDSESFIKKFLVFTGLSTLGSLVSILAIPLLILLALAAIIMSIFGPLLKLFGIVKDVPDDVESKAKSEVKGQVGELGMPIEYVPYYVAAEKKYHVPWMLLVAVHKRETDFGKMNPMKSAEGGIGHMLFMPSLWAGSKWKYNSDGEIEDDNESLTSPATIAKGGGFGVDADEDNKADPYNPADAVYAIANVLSNKGVSEGATEADLRAALLTYRSDTTYVDQVLDYYKQLNDDKSIATVDTTQEVSSSSIKSWPTTFSYNITSGYGYRVHPIDGTSRFHTGIDIASAGILGKPATSVSNGTVIFAGEKGGYGKTVIIESGNQSILYGHLKEILVTNGQAVTNGQQIGLVGSTGRSTGPHLHFEVRVNGNPVDPMPYLKQ